MSNQDYSTNSYNFQPLQIESSSSVERSGTTSTESSNNRLKRFLPIILLVGGILLLLIFALLLFGRNTTPSNNVSVLDPNKNVVLQWWGAFLDPEVIQPIIDQYKSIRPNVTIEYANKWPEIEFSEAEARYKEEINRVLKLNDTVQLPDIFMVNNGWVGDYEKFISPSANITYTEFRNTYFSNVLTDFGASNRVYGLPLWMDTLAVVYNKEMLANEAVSTPPTDWSQFRSLAQRLTKRSGSNITQAGFAGGISPNISYSFELANVLLFQNGVSILDSTNLPILSEDSDSEVSINFLNDFLGGTSPTWNTNLKRDAVAFLEEDLAMMVTPSYRLREILRYNQEYNINLEIGVSGLPQLVGQDQSLINFGDYWGNVVTLNRPNKEYAWEFMKWLNEPEQLRSLSANIKNKEGNFGLLYPRLDMLEDNQTDEYLAVYNESLPFIKSWYMVDRTEVKAAFDERFRSGTISSAISSFENDILDIIARKGILE